MENKNVPKSAGKRKAASKPLQESIDNNQNHLVKALKLESPEPKRVSHRAQKPESLDIVEKEEEYVPRRQDRGTIVPIGLTRRPFHLNPLSARDRVFKNLAIAMEMDFVSTPYKKVGISDGNKKKKGNFEEEEKQKHIEVLIGDEYQVEVPEWSEQSKEMKEDEEIEECMWIPPSEESLQNSDDQFYQIFFLMIWGSIWRQFESQIPLEMVLQKFMECGYVMGSLLETVDQCLMKLPQRMQNVAMGQAKRVNQMIEIGISMEEIQKTAMKNFHLGEIHQFIVTVRKFYKAQMTHGLPCNCGFPICGEVYFEPRYGCKNCSKNLRDTTHYPATALCLICKVYKKIARRDRPAENVFWNDEELELIQKWSQIEEKLGKKLEREEFLELYEQERKARWMSLELTPEEVDAMDYGSYKGRKKGTAKKPLSDEEKLELGSLVCQQLEPLRLPHFSKCYCKYKFSQNQEEIFIGSLVEMNGNLEKTAKKLKVDLELVARFLDVYGKESGIWENLDTSWHKPIERPLLPNLFMERTRELKHKEKADMEVKIEDEKNYGIDFY